MTSIDQTSDAQRVRIDLLQRELGFSDTTRDALLALGRYRMPAELGGYDDATVELCIRLAEVISAGVRSANTLSEAINAAATASGGFSAAWGQTVRERESELTRFIEDRLQTVKQVEATIRETILERDRLLAARGDVLVSRIEGAVARLAVVGQHPAVSTPQPRPINAFLVFLLGLVFGVSVAVALCQAI